MTERFSNIDSTAAISDTRIVPLCVHKPDLDPVTARLLSIKNEKFDKNNPTRHNLAIRGTRKLHEVAVPFHNFVFLNRIKT